VQYSVRDINKAPGTTHLEVEVGLGSTRVLFDDLWADATVSASKAGEALCFEIGDTAEVTFSCSGGVLSLVRSTTPAPKLSFFSTLAFVLASFTFCALSQFKYTLVARKCTFQSLSHQRIYGNCSYTSLTRNFLNVTEAWPQLSGMVSCKRSTVVFCSAKTSQKRARILSHQPSLSSTKSFITFSFSDSLTRPRGFVPWFSSIIPSFDFLACTNFV